MQNKVKEQLTEIVKSAGEAIMEVYRLDDFSNVVDFKADDSPLTQADKSANEVITKKLKEYFPDIPILSEEGRSIPYEERKDWNEFWLVDPLDGTKEFIKRNGQFTVNIALIRDNYPALGIVYTPVTDIVYYGDAEGAYKIKNGETSSLIVNNKPSDRIAVRSASHASEEEEDVLNSYDCKNSISIGSSLKFCMVAEGRADLYYRHGPTMEWDTGAGQAVVEAAGGHVIRFDNKKRFHYNREDLLNPSFLVLGFEE
ncbi:3'(2'),5'-bisphosphate nucleotidase CysQ [Mangrovivirga sp. M17]|uniref:3'(2'),5'-bisphosphate nucleotidase CysQ n=1 Tax=Mangrovivirga halotolerans TaxID=2993936 RepID=A0ABT3RSK5_9BACT|nr:3'(2'),5'-bisphosphate nucleotidase CysQ [Mangrovivirga halotolerans]MCX2744616.1 3'(2'),5'-bisphosphate nucleotidase CysQ [Mangrovivirga halotolerans]